MRKLALFFLAIALVLTGTRGAVRAQNTGRATLFALETSAFPTFRVLLDVFDAHGNFVTDLLAGEITLLEDHQPLAPTRLELLRPGVQFAVALDPDRSFGLRTGDSVSRLERIKTALLAWAQRTSPEQRDSLHLALTGIGLKENLTPQAFYETLSAYQPDLVTIKPSLDTLSQALDAVSGAPLEPGMKRVVLYIASPPAASAVSLLQNMTQRAEDLNIRVHVWIVMPFGQASTEAVVALKDLALRTGGQYVVFDPANSLPDLESYLAPLRFVYALEYRSTIRSGNPHTLSVQITRNGEILSSNTLTFDFTVLPPTPILVSPPEQIVRQGADRFQTDFSLFRPTQQEIQALFEFPDGHPRRLTRTALYVDGTLVDENTSEPFDRFFWDLSEYRSSAEHLLQVEAVDELGLSNVSLATPVKVTVIQPERGLAAFLAINSRRLLIIAISLAGLTLVISLLVGLRHKRSAPPSQDKHLSGKPTSLRQTLKLSRGASKQPEAYLVRLKEDGEAFDAPPLSLNAEETVFGTDPLYATRVLNDPSVSPVHARLKYAQGQFILEDAKSVAGTWVNYERLEAPRTLKHGDILHIGRVCYRFLLRKPPFLPPPEIKSLEK
ncbi:MAG: FHA domain-containing protein [Anaerolineales bacterium]|nr:FHA domain-containing protein [Anaerolineales bacterium]MDW8227051.1 FHA domain-containing protein [Anaerolineales bacterium]